MFQRCIHGIDTDNFDPNAGRLTNIKPNEIFKPIARRLPKLGPNESPAYHFLVFKLNNQFNNQLGFKNADMKSNLSDFKGNRTKIAEVTAEVVF